METFNILARGLSGNEEGKRRGERLGRSCLLCNLHLTSCFWLLGPNTGTGPLRLDSARGSPVNTDRDSDMVTQGSVQCLEQCMGSDR